MAKWSNWSGVVQCRPVSLAQPRSEEEVVGLVRSAISSGSTVRAAGSGHSFTPLCATDGTLIDLHAMSGVLRADGARCEAVIAAGTLISDLGAPLLAAGLALENQGDVDYQALAGAISTGTHGTGPNFGSLSTGVAGLRLVLPSGEIVNCSETQEPELFQAARLSLGVLGVITEITMRLLPAYRLHERTWVASFEETAASIDELTRSNEHFEFFWLPAHDAAVIKTLNSTNEELSGLPAAPPGEPGTLERYVGPERVDWSYRIYPSQRLTRFVEMEFALPAAQGPQCLLEIRQLMQQRHPQAQWAVEYRTQRGDDLPLSPVYQRDSVTISIHEAPDGPYQAFFADAEAVFRNHNGRPHWAKLHAHTARELRALYPQWDFFQSVREQVDPTGVFLNPYLRQMLIGE